MMKLDCLEVREWLRRDLDGAADPSSEVAEHIERCKGCTREAERIRALASAARECLPRAAVPFDFTDRVMDAVTEPVGDDALADAVRPRRSLALAVVVLMVGLTVLVFWPRGEKEGSGAATGSLAEGEVAAEAGMVFLLSEQGELVHRGKPLSLDGVIGLLNQEKPDGLLLRASARAPWQQVQWFLIACAEAKVWKIRLAVGRGPARDAFLPRDRGINLADPARPLKIEVRAVGLREVREQRGPADFRRAVGVPTVIFYSEPGRSAGTRNIDEVARWVAEAKRVAQRRDREVYGEIKAAHKVPFGAVFGILRSFQEAGFRDIRFYGTSAPSRELRRRSWLPYPKSNWVGEPGQPVPAEPDRVVEEAIEEEAEEIRERLGLLGREIAKGGDPKRIAQLRVELAEAEKRLDARKRLVALQRQLEGSGGPGRGDELRRENLLLRARIALLEAERRPVAARLAYDSKLAFKRAFKRAVMQQREVIRGLEAESARNPGDVALQAKLRKARTELLAKIADLNLQIARLYTGGGPAGVGRAKPGKPLSSKQLIELFTARARRIHGEFQEAWAKEETAAANAAKRRLDETRELLNRAAGLQEMQAGLEERKKKGQPTDDLEAKIRKELASLRDSASPARAGEVAEARKEAD